MDSLNPATGGAPASMSGTDPNPIERYEISRDADGRVTCWVHRGFGVRASLKHLVRHSPDGFEIGYAGSGPTELARCILLCQLERSPEAGRDIDRHAYQLFRDTFLADPHWRDGRVLTARAIEDWVANLRAQRFTLEVAS